MKNHPDNPYVTEKIRRFDGAIYGVCYLASFLQRRQENRASLNLRPLFSMLNESINEKTLIIIPLQSAELQQLIIAPERYSYLQEPSVRLAINYAQLDANFPALQALARQFRFWLYDFAPPGANVSVIERFPFCGIAFNESFFNDNYQKFSFPYLLQFFHERKTELILRTATPQLSEQCYKSLCINGWQQQRHNQNLFVF